ncbi:MAG: HEAT repeat domain-containing protein [Candidatus Zixiibacteriota bacterium]
MTGVATCAICAALFLVPKADAQSDSARGDSSGTNTAAHSLPAMVDSLYVIASSGELKHRDRVEPAREALVNLGAPAVPRLVDKLTTPDARERLTVIRVLSKMGATAVPALRRSLVTLKNSLQMKRICWALGDMDEVAAPAVPELIVAAGDPDWQTREYALRALGKIGDTATRGYVVDALSDPVGQVRKSAAWAAGKLKAGAHSASLARALADNYYGARLNASDALVMIGPAAAPDVISFIANAAPAAGDLGCETLGRICFQQEDPVVTTFLVDQLRDSRALRRAAAARALGFCAGSALNAPLQSLRLTEQEPYVIQTIDEAVERIMERQRK